MKPRAIIVVNADWFFLSHRLPIARALRDEGFDVLIAAGPERGCEDRIRAEGLRFVPLPVSRRSVSFSREGKLLSALVRLYKHERPAIVHHVTSKPVILGSIAATLARVPAVVNAIPGQGYIAVSRSAHAVALRFIVYEFYRRFLGGDGKRVIFQNPTDRSSYVARGLVREEHAVLIRGSGVDLQAFSPRPQPAGDPVLLFAARLLWSKGIGEYVDAVRILRQRGLSFRALIAGEPDVENPDTLTENQLREWHDGGVIEWLGEYADMPALLGNCSIFVLPSYREGLPKVLLEAAACGRAIVTTDAPGCREAVEHGRNGYLVPVADSTGLADAIEKLLRDRALRERFGERSRAIAVESFSEQLVVEQTLNVYRDLIGSVWPQKTVLRPVTAAVN